MFLAHSIRLREPWQCDRAPDGSVRCSRVFHRPTGLEPDDQLLLVISGLPLGAQVTVNNHSFTPPRKDLPPPSPIGGGPGRGSASHEQPAPSIEHSAPSIEHQASSHEHPASSIKHPAPSIQLPTPAQFDLTPILTDANRIEVLIPAASSLPSPASSLQPPASFPFDARLAIIGHS